MFTRWFPFFLCPALVGLTGCGPSDLSQNVEDPGPIDSSFAVSDYYTASGFMGDGENAGFLTVKVNDGCLPRIPGAEGNCFRFRYTPGETKWAGVFWAFPANNWGDQAGRAIATKFDTVRFSAAAAYDIVLPAGAGLGGACTEGAEPNGCRPGLSCSGGACIEGGTTPLGDHCLVSGECADAAQCVGQTCVAAGPVTEGQPCGTGRDADCADGLRCGVVQNTFTCVPEGPGDVGNACATRNDCRGGLMCESSVCKPRTVLEQVAFKIGGIQNFFKAHSDPYSKSYSSSELPPDLSPDWTQFRFDISGSSFDELIGAFMWATPFPDIDEVTTNGLQAYLADPTKPLYVWVDDIYYEEAVDAGGAL